MKKPKMQKCKNCRRLFKPSYLHRVYCSHECFEKYQQKLRYKVFLSKRIIRDKTIKYEKVFCPHCGLSYDDVSKKNQFELDGCDFFHCKCREMHPREKAIIPLTK